MRLELRVSPSAGSMMIDVHEQTLEVRNQNTVLHNTCCAADGVGRQARWCRTRHSCTRVGHSRHVWLINVCTGPIQLMVNTSEMPHVPIFNMLLCNFPAY